MIRYLIAAAALFLLPLLLGQEECAPVDTSPDPMCVYYLDRDGDGYGDRNSEASFVCDEAPDNYVEDDTDCGDHNAATYPGAPEFCDDQDDDCDGDVDEDSDGDGFEACEDCAPADPAIYPGVDFDGDGFSCDEECAAYDDFDSSVYPGADGDPNTCR